MSRTATSDSWLCAFVRMTGDGQQLLQSHGGESLAQFGDIHIAHIPLAELGALSREVSVTRIEAGSPCKVTMDTVATCMNAHKAYQGEGLPQAYTGKGVVVGVQDIGFDLTHPNFYDRTGSRYRIRALWDQLSTDESTLAVGADYVGQEALLAYRHSRDGNDQTHGTHTTGIAAGSGYNSPYRGMAYESDICLVANATSNNAELIDEADRYKYTYATDALGFKYIFDYAQAHNMPCVASFSEGSHQDFYGDDILYYEVLQSLVGAGRILVASAGNESLSKSFFRKPKDVESDGTFVSPSGGKVFFTLKGTEDFAVRIVGYAAANDTLTVTTHEVLSMPDSLRTDSIGWTNVMMTAYPSAYNPHETVMEVLLADCLSRPISIEVVGKAAEVCFYNSLGYLTTNTLNPNLTAGEASHNVLSPGSAPAVICVGASSYRTDIYTHQGEHSIYNMGTQGEWGYYSSVGPTYDERIKPDVLAPGTNVVSSYNSFYIENHPDAWDVQHSVKQLFPFQDRTYAWTYNSGTSMSTPAVAGAIALWLQAKPDLTPSEVRDLLAKTCTHHDPTLDYPNNQYGYGEIDVYHGLLELLGLTAVEGLSTRQPNQVAIMPETGGVKIVFDTIQQHDFTIRVYTANGQLAHTARMQRGQDRYHLSLPGLPRGVYAVQVDTHCKGTTGSQLIRL